MGTRDVVEGEVVEVSTDFQEASKVRKTGVAQGTREITILTAVSTRRTVERGRKTDSVRSVDMTVTRVAIVEAVH